MKIYHWLGRVASPFYAAAFWFFNRVFHIPRARIMVWNEDDELLLVRNWSGKQQWSLPGGGVARKERPVAAAKRELYEEVGLNIPLKDFIYVATLHHQYEAPIFTVTILKDDLPAKPHNPKEITNLRWFSPKELPADISPLVALALKSLSKTM